MTEHKETPNEPGMTQAAKNEKNASSERSPVPPALL